MDPETGASERWVAYYSYSAYGVEVAVDEDTGAVTLERVVACCDMGNPIHPKMCEQQVEGAMGQGIGITLFEEMVTDRGGLLNAGFVDYKIPTSLDTPRIGDVATIFAAAPQSEGPFGAKGFGEAAFNPFYAAVANAFFHATGVRMTEMPLSKERVYWALKAAEKGARAEG
jgi:CO/xanthine dehydrogenase Mo-binding subunit